MITAARIRFALFVLIVLAGPAALIVLGGPKLVDPRRLVLILGPAISGWALNRGLGDRNKRADWRAVATAGLVTLAVTGSALAIALLGGAASFARAMSAASGATAVFATAVFATAVTSILEELGWAGGGLGMVAAGLTGLDAPHPWWLLPAPGGLVFLALTLLAISRQTHPRKETPILQA